MIHQLLIISYLFSPEFHSPRCASRWIISSYGIPSHESRRRSGGWNDRSVTSENIVIKILWMRPTREKEERRGKKKFIIPDANTRVRLSGNNCRRGIITLFPTREDFTTAQILVYIALVCVYRQNYNIYVKSYPHSVYYTTIHVYNIHGVHIHCCRIRRADRRRRINLLCSLYYI